MGIIHGKPKAITFVSYFDKDNLAEHGFITEFQQNAVMSYANYLEDIKKQPGKFGTMIFLVGEADLLNHRPMMTWSNLSFDSQKELYEDYYRERLKIRKEPTHD